MVIICGIISGIISGIFSSFHLWYHFWYGFRLSILMIIELAHNGLKPEFSRSLVH